MDLKTKNKYLPANIQLNPIAIIYSPGLLLKKRGLCKFTP
jgi:hypothetical protein